MKRLIHFFLAVMFCLCILKANGQDETVETLSSFKPLPDTAFIDTIFNGHQHHLQVSEDEIQPLISERMPSWLFYVFLIQLIIVACVRVYFPRSFNDMLRALMSINISQQLYREQQLTMPVSAILYNINFVLSGGLFLFLINTRYHFVSHDLMIISMLFFIWMVIVIYSLRYGIMKFVTLVFPFGNVVEQYNFNFFIVQKIMGLALLPLNLLIAYGYSSFSSAAIFISTGIVFLFHAGRTIKGLTIARHLIARNAFHFFVYICALEIAPVCILIKAVFEWLS